MNSRELVLRAVGNHAVPRIPWVPFCGVHSASLIGRTATECLQDTDLAVAAQSRAIELYRPDGIPVLFDLQIEAEILGCPLKWSDDNPPAVIGHPLEDGVCDIADLRLPEPSDGRIPILVEATRRLREKFPEIALYGLITGPFTLALHLLGTGIFIRMYDQPEETEQLLDFCADVGRRMSDFYIDAGIDIVAVVDPMTSQIGPEQFTQFCRAPAAAIFNYVREKGKASSFFVCGHAQQNIEVMCECGCDNISIDENIPLDYVRELCRKKGVSFGGNLQLTVVMLTGTTDDNRRNALECMEIGGSKGYILSPGCDIPFATPPENIQAIVEMVLDEYKRQVAREMVRTSAEAEMRFDMTEYGRGDQVVVDIITLDSEACAPCQYMVESVKKVTPEFEGLVVWREHKIKYRESIAFMLSLMVRNIPTICIDGQITFVSRIPRREELIGAIQKRINEKLKIRIGRQNRIIRVVGQPDEACLELRENVRQALNELGSAVKYEEIEDPEQFVRHGVATTPAVTVVRQTLKSEGQVPPVVVIKEWLKQLEE